MWWIFYMQHWANRILHALHTCSFIQHQGPRNSFGSTAIILPRLETDRIAHNCSHPRPPSLLLVQLLGWIWFLSCSVSFFNSWKGFVVLKKIEPFFLKNSHKKKMLQLTIRIVFHRNSLFCFLFAHFKELSKGFMYKLCLWKALVMFYMSLKGPVTF